MAEQKKKTITRRKLFKGSTLVLLGGALTLGVGGLPLLRSKEHLLRPPGAVEEDEFLASCIKCGQCLQVCPPQVIELAKIDQGFGIGTPFIVPQEGACILCKGLPCVLACPTGALDHDISEGKDADMGLAVLSSPQTCLAGKAENDLVFLLEQAREKNTLPKRLGPLKSLVGQLFNRLLDSEKQEWQTHYKMETFTPQILYQTISNFKDNQWGEFLERVKAASFAQKGCRVCLEECPIKEQHPIVFQTGMDGDSENSPTLPMVQKTCVGCGVCEEKCPTFTPSITIQPRLKWNNRSKQEKAV